MFCTVRTIEEKRRFWLYLAVACLGYIGIESLCYLSLKVLSAKGVLYQPLPSGLTQEQKQLLKTRFEEGGTLRNHHPVLGWAPKPLTHSPEVRINSEGIRSDRDYPHEVNPKIVRISAFGDSFTFGSDVSNSDTWEHQLEEQAPYFEVLNFGVGAYGLDQAYLRYLEDGVPFHSDIVIIGFMSENIYRNLNVFRPFYSSSYATSLYTKPRFSLQNSNLVLLKNPLTTTNDYERLLTDDATVLKEIGSHDYFYQLGYRRSPLDILPSVRLLKIATRSVKTRFNPVVTSDGSYDVSSEGFLLTTRLFEEFYCQALQHESLPVIVIYPNIYDLANQRSGQKKGYQPLLVYLNTRSFQYFDVLDALVSHDPTVPTDRLTVGKWGHYSRLGNTIIANGLREYFNGNGLNSRDAIKKLARTTGEKQNCRAEAE